MHSLAAGGREEEVWGDHSLHPWGGAVGTPAPACRDQEGRRGSEEAVPGPSVFPSREPSVSANFCGRIKGVNYRFALKDGTWDFPGDSGNFGVPLE